MKTKLLTVLAVLCALTTTAFAQVAQPEAQPWVPGRPARELPRGEGGVFVQPGQPGPVRRLPGSPPPGPPLDAESVNYQIRIQWKQAGGGSNALQISTAEGSFTVTSAQTSSVKINNAEIPITLNFRGDLELLSADKARLKIFLGRTVPYVTGATGGPASPMNYQQTQQMQLGLDSTVVVTFGKPLVIQADEREEITLTVKRLDG